MVNGRIMVVEDDPIIALVLIERLKRLNYEVCARTSKGEDAVKLAEQTAPDLVLMDIKLEGKMDGIEAARQLRSLLNLSVVYVTAFTDDSLLERAKKTEPLGYLVKTYGEKELRSTLEMALYKAEMERRLRKSEARYRRLVENAPLGILSFDSEGRITEYNLRLLSIFQVRDPNDVEHLNVLESPSMVDAGFGQDFRACLERGQSVVTEGPYLPANRQERIFVRFNIVPVRSDDGRIIGGQAIAEDITERKKGEELQQQTARYRAVADIAAGVAHNFNNLLQIIMGNASFSLLKLESGDYSGVKESLEQIGRGCSSLAETVRRLQRLVATGSDPAAAKVETFDLSAVAQQATEASTTWWKDYPEWRGTEIALSLRLEQGCWIRGKKDEIFEVLVNLVKNAAEALPQGGEIAIEAIVRGDSVVVQVCDNGKGILAEHLGRLFTPFFTTNPEIGRGLGLATARRIVDSHGGKIFVDSVEGRGTTVKITLPLADRPPEPVEIPAVGTPPARLTVLAIDDMEDVLKMLKLGLEKWNHSVLTALSGQEGVEIFKAHRVDAVVCDLAMPGMNGRQVAETLRDYCKKLALPKPPFIILTGWAELPEDELHMTQSGVDAVIAKPADLAKLLGIIAGLTQAEQIQSQDRT